MFKLLSSSKGFLCKSPFFIYFILIICVGTSDTSTRLPFLSFYKDTNNLPISNPRCQNFFLFHLPYTNDTGRANDKRRKVGELA